MWRRLRCRISGGGRQEASFQDQACCGQEPQQLVKADAIADRRQLVGQCIFVPDRGATADLFRRKGFGHGRCQPQSIVAKARIDVIHAFGEQRRDRDDTPQRVGEVELDLRRDLPAAVQAIPAARPSDAGQAWHKAAQAGG